MLSGPFHYEHVPARVTLPWRVGNASDNVVANFPTEEAARAHCARLNRDFIDSIPAHFRGLPLTLAAVTRVSVERSTRWHPGGLTDWSIADWAVAMAGEAGEACNAVKKLKRVEEGIANLNESDRTLATREAAIAAIGDELADTLLYLVLLAARCGIDLDAAVAAKFNATSERYGFPERL